MTRVLVTGATGFVGSAVVRRLASEGFEVLALSGRRPSEFEHANVRWRQFDLLGATAGDLDQLVSSEQLTHCIHAAWYTEHSNYLTHEINRQWVLASLRLAKALGDINAARLVALGTLQEYDPSVGICAEDKTPLNPETLYARCKLELYEQLGRSGLDFAWPRIFFTYGPGDRAARLVPNMIDHFSRGEAAGPNCGGLRRDYIHVDDLAGQLVRIMTCSVQGAINTGTGEAPSLSEIYAIGARVFGRPDLALANDQTDGQAPLIVPDMSRFRREVGETQTRNIEQGLADLIGHVP